MKSVCAGREKEILGKVKSAVKGTDVSSERKEPRVSRTVLALVCSNKFTNAFSSPLRSLMRVTCSFTISTLVTCPSRINLANSWADR